MSDGLKIEGLAELAQRLPNDAWHRLTIYVRKDGNGAEILFDPYAVETAAFVADGCLWERDQNDELRLLVASDR